MIYRKSPLQPTRLLLRIVAGAGAGVLVGATACGSDDSAHPGIVVMPSSGSSVGGGLVGSVGLTEDSGADAREAEPPDGDASGDEASTVGGGVSPCHPCGVVVMPHEDSGTDASQLHGVVPFGDGAVLGVVVMPGGGIQPAPDDASAD
jgi:hypothetical protein